GTVDPCLAALNLEQQIGHEADDRIATTRRAILHALQKIGVRAPGRELEIGAHRRLKIRDDATPDDPRLSGSVLRGEDLGIVRHFLWFRRVEALFAEVLDE